ncbi:hypothetical protein PsorP6_018898 [Peronosclerospora sorghi]|nr:hypothetical protein PsorP6_018898 [Peronosclerospora sorghi]
MHSSWETKQVLLEMDPLTNKQKIKRFHEKDQQRLQHPHRKREDLDEDSMAIDDLDGAFYLKQKLRVNVHAILKTMRLFPTTRRQLLCPLEGLNWLLWNWYNERPSILADEMGLGKTIPTLSFLNLLRDDPKIWIRGPFLIVAPLSLIVQWQNECEIWTTMNCVVYQGNTASREIIREFEFNYLDENLRPDKKKPYRFNILVTTYEVAIKYIGVLSKIHWRCLVVDESHRLKKISPRDWSSKCAPSVVITGKSFPSISNFLDKFGDLHEAQKVADLQKMLNPYLLRRVKEDVEKSLPPKE